MSDHDRTDSGYDMSVSYPPPDLHEDPQVIENGGFVPTYKRAQIQQHGPVYTLFEHHFLYLGLLLFAVCVVLFGGLLTGHWVSAVWWIVFLAVLGGALAVISTFRRAWMFIVGLLALPPLFWGLIAIGHWWGRL